MDTKLSHFPLFFLVLFIFIATPTIADDQICLDCHTDPTLTTERNGKVIQLFIKAKDFSNSVHGKIGCIACHEDVDENNLPHEPVLKKVSCQKCHENESKQHAESLHGQAFKRGDPYAPTCITCHGSHYITPSSDPKSPTYVMNIPLMCGRCHKEGSPMVKVHNIPEKDIIQNYSMSIHGEGLFKRGLTVTAVCTNCHTAHHILPHTDSRSSINRNNIAGTCMKCHTQIAQVHQKVIRGELWKKSPNLIPACVECHSPHKIRRIFYSDTMSDEYCMNCHKDRNLVQQHEGKTKSLFVDIESLRNSAHGQIQCIKCHANMNQSQKPVCKDSGPVDCSMCHAEEVLNYQNSIHGTLFAQNDPNAPSCKDCHGTHETLPRSDLNSPTFTRNIPQLCAQCHREGEKAAVRYTGQDTDIIKHYSMSIHGKGLTESGLMVTAVCTSCHTAHSELPASNIQSSVHPQNIGKTCAQCHLGVYEEFKSSIHSPEITKTDKKLPTCHDCHNAHEVDRIDKDSFRQQILAECGTCHEEVTSTYFDTYHGKVSLLGSGKTAKCSDCHGAHDILPPEYPQSHLSQQNVVATCKKCHPNSNRQFTGYLSHATHHNKTKYPFLFYTFWAMTVLLVSTFTIFGIHTLLWLPRSFIQRLKLHKKLRSESKSYYVRFDRIWRILHLIVIVSFFALALTGMILKFAGTGWAVFFANLMGGFENAGLIHRTGAILTFIYFGVHFVYVYKNWKLTNKTLRQFIFDKETGMAPTWNDLKEFFQTIRWFFTGKNQPNYGRWTYWEKFDYLAVFWGVAMIGFTGLILWFPEFFTRFLPGYFINIATIIHSDEALLATGFIFTFHFFNTHFRPEKFPMDPVIFTGKVPLEEFKIDRPREYNMVKEDGTLRKKLAEGPEKWFSRLSYIFGLSCLIFGYLLIGMIIWAMLFQYK